MFCIKCGAVIPEGAEGCPNCKNENTSAEPAVQQDIVSEPKKEQRSDVYAIVAIILAIAATFLWFIPFVGIPLAILGIVFGILAINTSLKVMSIIAIVISSIFFFVAIVYTIFFTALVANIRL